MPLGTFFPQVDEEILGFRTMVQYAYLAIAVFAALHQKGR
jgi:hypothetical protein